MSDRDLFEATFVERATARGFSHPERLLTKGSDGEYWLQTTQNCWIGWCWSQAQVRRMRDEMVGLLQRVYDADQAARHEKPYNVSELMDDIERVLQRHQQ